MSLPAQQCGMTSLETSLETFIQKWVSRVEWILDNSDLFHSINNGDDVGLHNGTQNISRGPSGPAAFGEIPALHLFIYLLQWRHYHNAFTSCQKSDKCLNKYGFSRKNWFTLESSFVQDSGNHSAASHGRVGCKGNKNEQCLCGWQKELGGWTLLTNKDKFHRVTNDHKKRNIQHIHSSLVPSHLKPFQPLFHQKVWENLKTMYIPTLN